MTRTLIVLLALFSFVVACTAGSCARYHNPLQQKIEEVREELESGRSINRAVPFAERTFQPTLGGTWIGNAVAYGCYREGQAPGRKGPGKTEILEDLSIITKYWNLIRVYGADDDTERILQVIQENNIPVRVMVGVWLENEEDNPGQRKANVEQVVRGIALAHQYTNIVAAVSVGNETQVSWSSHRMRPENLIRYLRAVRNHTTVPVTTADDYGFWDTPGSKQVTDEIDFVLVHIHPLWNGKTLETAIEWIDQMYHAIQDTHPKKLVVIGETGWATSYNPAARGPGGQGTVIKGEVSIQAQETFLMTINEWVKRNKITTFLFEAFDEPWKGGGEHSEPNEIEKHWGVFYENRMAKESFQNYLKHIPGN